MQEPHFVILYVDNPSTSAAFYADLLGRPALESSPTFAMFALQSGVMLGLWSRHSVEPAVQADAGGSELAFTVDGTAAVDALHEQWRQRGIAVIQTPLQMDFGYTFLARDPDGHRLRVFAPSQEPARPA